MEGEIENLFPKKKKSYIKRISKIILYIFIGLIGLNVVLYALLSIPAVQKQVLDFAVNKVKDITKTEISIDKIQLKLLYFVSLDGVYIEDQKQDTLLYAKNLEVRIYPWDLLQNKLNIGDINIEGTTINISQETSDSPFNFQFLIDVFASDSTKEDTSSSSLKIAIGLIKIKDSKISYNITSDPDTINYFNPSHITIDNLNAELSLGSIDMENLNAEIKKLSFREKSGLTVSNIEAKLRSKGDALWTDKLTLSLPHSSLDIDSLRYNLASDQFILEGNTSISPLDVAAVMPDINRLDSNIVIKTRISGKLPSVSVDSLILNYGDKLSANAKASISNYNRLDTAKIHLYIDGFKITPEGITQFARMGDSTFTMPDILPAKDPIRLQGSIEGPLSDINLKAEAWIKYGSVILDGKVATDTSFQNFKIDTRLNTQNFNIAPFVGEEVGFNRLSARSNISVNSTPNALIAKINGTILSLQHKNYTFKDIRFNADYNPKQMSLGLLANSTVGKITAEASMSQSNNPDIDFNLKVKNFKIDQFYENPAWENPRLTVNLIGNLKGADIDNMQGHAEVDSLHFWGDNFNYKPAHFTLDMGKDKDDKFIKLRSAIIDATISGQYLFASLADEFANLMSKHMPTFFVENKRIRQNKNSFDINISIKNSETLSNLFELPVTVIEPIDIKGAINLSGEDLKIKADIPYIIASDQKIQKGVIEFIANDSIFTIDGNADWIQAKEGRIALKLGIKKDDLDTFTARIYAQNDSVSGVKLNGNLWAVANFRKEKNELVSSVRFLETPLNIGKLNLSVLSALIENKGETTKISNLGLGLNGKRYIGIDGVISPRREDSLYIKFDKTQLGDLLAGLDINNIKAEANGRMTIIHALDNPSFFTDNFSLNDITVFGDTLGTLFVKSGWSNSRQAILFKTDLQNKISSSIISGVVYPEKDSIDININLNKFPLKWMQPFVADFVTKLDGSISSKFSIKGGLNKPLADGWLGFNDVSLRANYTNVTYRISDTIKVLPDKMGFRDLTIRDNNNNTATASALLTHQNFKNMEYGLNLDLKNFLILNTQNRTDSLFYGKLMASGKVKIRGNDQQILIDMPDIRNSKGSNLNITIPDITEASDYQSIVYINTPDQDSAQIEDKSPISDALPIKLNMGLTVTPDINLGIVINPTTGDFMQVKGNGDIKFSYDMEAEDMKAFGDYTLTDGIVKLKLQNIATLEFKIKEGSKLIFSGDPMRTSFNITAYRRVRANLATLDASFSTSRIAVDCILGIKGDIQKMELTYDVSLPDASDDIRNKVKSLMTTEDQKIRQFAYLIASGSFYSNSQGGGNIGSNMWTSIASSTLSDGLNSLLGNMLGDKWEIGTNLSTSDGSFSDMDMSVNVSTKFLDDKLKLNTNLGYRTDQTTTSENTFVGDFDLEYELSRTIRLKAYNHTNDRMYKQAPTTQGIGIQYTKEAKALRNLFDFFRRKKKTEKEPQKTTN